MRNTPSIYTGEKPIRSFKNAQQSHILNVLRVLVGKAACSIKVKEYLPGLLLLQVVQKH